MKTRITEFKFNVETPEKVPSVFPNPTLLTNQKNVKIPKLNESLV